MASITDPALLHPVARVMLDDLRRAAAYFDELGDVETPPLTPALARDHARRLWAASQMVERLVVAVEQAIIQGELRRPWSGDIS
jgi:hypothetical protein